MVLREQMVDGAQGPQGPAGAGADGQDGVRCARSYWSTRPSRSCRPAGGSDDQNLTAATLSGNTLQIDIENGNSVTVDLSSIGGAQGPAGPARSCRSRRVNGAKVLLVLPVRRSCRCKWRWWSCWPTRSCCWSCWCRR